MLPRPEPPVRDLLIPTVDCPDLHAPAAGIVVRSLGPERADALAGGWLSGRRFIIPGLIRALVEPLLPDKPILTDEQRALVEREVVAFVWDQIGAMPRFLRLPYELALLGFDLGAVVRYGRPFRLLDEARRRAYLGAWSRGPLRLGRDLVKLVRSCALLQYLDHPLVLARLEAEGAGPGRAI